MTYIDAVATMLAPFDDALLAIAGLAVALLLADKLIAWLTKGSE